MTRAGSLSLSSMALTAMAALLAGCDHGATGSAGAPPTTAGPAPTASATASVEPEPSVSEDEGEEPPLAVTGTPPPPASGRAALLAEVDRELGAMRTSLYAHHTHVDEAAGSFEYDCSALLDYALSRAVPDALAAVQERAARRPRSREYVTFLESIAPGAASGRWQRVARAAELLPGDVVVWLKPADSRSTNTGHTMIVHGPVVAAPGEPGAFVVPVADSTARPHGSHDGRAAAHTTGLGTGQIVLVTDAAGAPTSFRWSPGGREKPTTIALGRLR
jgi:hypothetical protein